jgi:hypothetical protein
MDHTICPGSKQIRSPKPETIICPSCAYAVEIWSDEARATCPRCNQNVVREGFSSCLDWCAKGKECVGETIFNNYMEKRSVTIRQMLMNELEALAARDTARVDRSIAVLRTAEELLRKECGDWSVVVPSAILHSLAENPGKGVEKARKILLKIGLQTGQIDEICTIITCYRTTDSNGSKNLKIVHDAVIVGGIPAHALVPAADRETFAIDGLLTPTARDIATALLAKTK